MIPNKIHYCWFGHNAKPKLAQKCINSWKKYCPGFEIIEWNESNFDVNQAPYLKWCYEHKKWAYLSDLARLIIVYENGGIYFDTDVELVRYPEKLLQYDAFFGFENDENVATGLGFGAIVQHPVIAKMIEQYKQFKIDEFGNMRMISCPALNTKALIPFGLKLDGKMQLLSDIIVLPAEYLNPYDDPTGRLNKTKNTISIHWYSKSALDKRTILRSNLTRPFHRLFGKDCFERIKRKQK